jgi:hypothetical protein
VFCGDYGGQTTSTRIVSPECRDRSSSATEGATADETGVQRLLRRSRLAAFARSMLVGQRILEFHV